ncbi:MAG TPA: TonB-dependent receptor [Candidatus Acidoferrales bacterium]|nr:TonB-dependent receptor [Candidatus Acidoferrales bacterium]
MRTRFILLLAITLLAFTAAVALAQQPVQTVVVTGTFEPLTLEEIDRSIRVLPARSQSLVLNSLVDLLRLDPSIDLEERAPGGVQTDVSIRGASFGQTLVLLNGQRLNDAQSGHHNMDIPVPLEAVSRVEVLRGSGSTMYGSDAVGGVINVITDPPPGFEFRVRTAAGNQGINQQQASTAFGDRKFSEQLSFARDFSSGFLPDRDYRNLQFASTTRLVTSLGTSSITAAYMDHPFGADQFYGNFNSWEDTKTWFAGFEQQIGPQTTASFSFRRHSDLFVLYRDQPEIFTNHHADESYQAALRRRQEIASSITLFYGAEELQESIVSNNLGYHSRNREAGYVDLDLRALKRFSLSVSAREEVYGSSTALSPTVSGAMWLSGKLKFRASGSKAFRIPSYTDLYYHDPGNVGNPDLRPEQAWTYEAGLDWIPSAKVRGDVTVFQRRLRDGIDYYRLSPTDIWQALNIQNLRFTGVEAALHLAPSRWQAIDLRYTWLEGKQDTVPLGSTKYTFNYPTNSGVLSWQMNPKGNFVLRTRVGVVDRRARDTYVLWDLYAALSRGKVHPFLQFSNLANTSYQEILGVPMPSRTVIGGVDVLLRKR